MMRLLPLIFTVALGACSYLPDIPLLGDQAPPPEPTLADLQPAVLPSVEEQVPARSLQELEQAYRQVLQVTRDPQLQLKVRHRLADLDMLAREAESADAPAGSVSYAGVIAAYRTLMQEYPDVAGSDQLLYQMARAHDLDGQGEKAVELMVQLSSEHPVSEHVVEAEFRKGEAYFSAGEYALAAQAYQRVVAGETANDYYANGLYMLGWSHFKQEHNEQALQAFTAALDYLMPQDNRMEQLSRGDREIAGDCFRVQAVIFDQWGGSAAITAAYQQIGPRGYQYLVYDALGQLYLKQERYQDSADTYANFIATHPAASSAHQFQNQIIAVYRAAGFHQQVIAAKADYVAAYGVSGEYWQLSDEARRQAIQPHLTGYIDELARHYHALAQSGEEQGVRDHYLRAADYYQLYVNSFPVDPRVPDMMFLMAETRDAAGEYGMAIRDYQAMAYRYPLHAKAPEAAYAAILAHAALDSVLAEDRLAMVESQLTFASLFPDDPRAPAVLAHAASTLLEQGEYARAALAAETLVTWQPAVDTDVVLPAWLVLAHAQFELGKYAAAEQAYVGALALLPVEDQRREQAVESVAASIYRQGEAASASGDHLLAADHFARVIQMAPDSEIRRNAQYDAAGSYQLAGDYDQANALLVEFRRRYPGHELTEGIGARLVENYETTGEWHAAAAELDSISTAGNEPAVQREALYLAAQYYQRAGDTELALQRYRRYAHTWKSPLGPRMEAMLALADIYAVAGETEKRHYWLRAMAEAHDGGGEQASERSLYLAASAVSELADGHYQAYTAVELTHPLPRSLRLKRKAMDQTVAAYDRVNSYGVQEFGTRATYRLGEVYHQLSEDLLNSPRPDDLDALALEQYELLLEEQAWPFEEKAVAIHETNVRRAWEGLHDPWIEQSFQALAEMMPARWGKREQRVAMSREIR